MKTTPRDNEPRVPFRKPGEVRFRVGPPSAVPRRPQGDHQWPGAPRAPPLENAARVISRVNEIPAFSRTYEM